MITFTSNQKWLTMSAFSNFIQHQKWLTHLKILHVFSNFIQNQKWLTHSKILSAFSNLIQNQKWFTHPKKLPVFSNIKNGWHTQRYYLLSQILSKIELLNTSKDTCQTAFSYFIKNQKWLTHSKILSAFSNLSKIKIASTPKDTTGTCFPENLNKIFSETILFTEWLQYKNINFFVFC